jgi:hypothetical protein
VIVTRLRDGEHVSTLAPVVGSDDDEAELVKATSGPPAPVSDAGPEQAELDDVLELEPEPDDDV